MAIQLPPNSSGTIVDTITLGGEDREVVVIGGNAAVAEESSVKNTSPAETVYGLVTRPIQRTDGETLSTTPLGVSGVFTQTGQDRNADGILYVMAAARSNVASAASGFTIEEYDLSDDFVDSNFVRTVAAVSVSANTTTRIHGAIRARKWRVKYTNGGTGQASFTLAATAQPVVPDVDSSGQLQVGVTALPDEGQQTMANSISVAVASDQSNVPGNTVQLGGTAISLNTGVRDAGSQRVTIATDDLVPISAASLPLPAGAATSALQLADGHNVTVDNAGAGSAVNIQDGGNSITVDIGSSVSVVDSNNSTTSTLGVSATYTGTATDILNYSAVTVQVFADEDGATDGMTFEFSIDGTNWDVMHTHTYTADEGRLFQFACHSQFFRFVFINGTTVQGAFRVETLLHPNTKLTTIHRLVDGTSPDRSTELVKAAIIAQAAGSGDFVPVQATASGNFKIAIEEAEGSIAGGGTEATALRVTVASDSTGTLTVDSGGVALLVDGSAVTQPISAATLPLPTGAATSAGQLADGHNVTVDNASLVVTNTVLSVVGGGTEAAAQRVTIANDSTGLLPISAASLPLPAGAATSALQLADGHNVTVDNAAGATSVFMQGAAATDATVAGNPVLIGGRSNDNEPTAVTADDEMVPFWLDRLGRLVTVGGHPSPEDPDVTTLSADGSLIATPGASVSLHICKGSVHNSAASEQVAALRDGSAGTIRWQANVAADGGGSMFDFGSRGWKLTANTALFGDAAASSLYYNVTEYYIAA